MELKVSTWNMDYWKTPKPRRLAAWNYLITELNSDISLLQETKPQVLFDGTYDIHYHKFPQRPDWGSAIIFRKYQHFEYSFNSSYEGSRGLMCFDFKISDKITITAINIYGKIDSEGYATTTLHHMLSDLTPLLHKYKKNRYFVIGGDFNASTQWDEKYNGRDPLHKLVFDRIEDFGMLNCTKEIYGDHIRTYSHNRKKSNFPWQDDYIFISRNLKKSLVSCNVHNNDKMLELSDHFPVEVIFDF